MGYTTDFYGEFDIKPPLTDEHYAYLTAFNMTRRVARDPVIAETLPDPLRIAAGLPIGEGGAYYVGSINDGQMGQLGDESVIDGNVPPGQARSTTSPSTNPNWYVELMANKDAQIKAGAQPGLWCQWRPAEDRKHLEWDGGEKFYDYEEWLAYIITNFLAPWGYKLNGEVEWQGEDRDDRGIMSVTNNQLSIKRPVVTWA